MGKDPKMADNIFCRLDKHDWDDKLVASHFFSRNFTTQESTYCLECGLDLTQAQAVSVLQDIENKWNCLERAGIDNAEAYEYGMQEYYKEYDDDSPEVQLIQRMQRAKN